jgi:hypothetical protein
MLVVISGTKVAACNTTVPVLTSSGSSFTFTTPPGCTSATGGNAGAACPGGACTQASNTTLINMLGVNDVEVKNMNLGPCYVKNFFSDPHGGSNMMDCVQFSGSNTNIHDNTIHDSFMPLNSTAFIASANVVIANNDLYHCGWCMGLAGGNYRLQDAHFTNNHMHDLGNFSDSGASGIHGNGIHSYDGSGGGIVNYYISNNLADGDMGQGTTSWYYLEGNTCGSNDTFGDTTGGSTGTLYFWNNVTVATKGGGNGLPNVNCGSGHVIVNNYSYCAAKGNGFACLWLGNPGVVGTGATVQNNVEQTGNVLIGQMSGTAPALVDYNVYGNASGGDNLWQVPGTSTSSFSTWQGAGFDQHGSASLGALLPNLNGCGTYECGAGVPSSGFVGINWGVNLSNLCTGAMASLCSDTTAGGTHVAIPRPTGTCSSQGSSGCWDIGAYQYNSGNPPPQPPTDLTATVK